MSDVSPSLAHGTIIADTYEVERKLGQGGMGEVWLARHRRLAGKQVAIKVLHVDRALPVEALARFKREAEIAARLEHPNIVQVSDFNTLPAGQPFLVMEFLKGQSLAARARGQALPLDQVLAIMRQVGAALQAAHRAGVVHRDLKPENIFLVPTALGDQVKVLDFGISKLSHSSTVQTTESVLIGTPLYMSPEQALGNNKDVTAQSDLFSLGSICYELLTGQAPFFADSVAKIVFRIAYEKHPPLSGSRPDLPATVQAAVEHLLEKDCAKRTPSIEAFVEELTGQALVEVRPEHDESSGVYSPGMSVTPSMVSGETVARATPMTPQPVPANAAAGARTVSGKVVMLSLLGAALVISAIAARVRTDNWAERAAYHARMLDAGYTMLPDGTFFLDAGSLRAEVADAGALLAEAAVDAGPAAAEVLADAGAVAVTERPGPEVEAKPVAITSQEKELLTLLERLQASGEWERLAQLRTRVFSELKSPTAQSRGLALVVEAACERRDQLLLMSVVSRLKAVSAAQSRRSREQCLTQYPDAASLDW